MGRFVDLLEDALRLFSATANPPVTAPPPPPPPRGLPDVTSYLPGSPWHEYFTLAPDRLSRYADHEKMDQTGVVAAVLDAVIDTALTWDKMLEDGSDNEMMRLEGPKIELGAGYGRGGPRRVIERTLRDTELKSKLREIGRDMLKYGDAFSELVTDELGDTIANLAQLQTTTITVNKDDRGAFQLGIDPTTKFPRAYTQRDGAQRIVAGWEPWEMVQWTLYPASGSKYSRRSLLDYMRADWYKLKACEEALVQARLTRSMPRRVIKVDVTNKDTLTADAYIKRRVGELFRKTHGPGVGNVATQTMPSVADDMVLPVGYTTVPGLDKPLALLDEVKLEDPNIHGLAETSDMKYLLGKMTAKAPGEMVGLWEQTKRDLSLQDISFGRFIMWVQARLTAGVRQIIDTALLLAGYRSVPYTVSWPRVIVGTDWKYADGQFRQSMAMANLESIDSITPAWAMHRLWNVPLQEAEAENQAKLAYNLQVKQQEFAEQVRQQRVLMDLEFEHAQRMQGLVALPAGDAPPEPATHSDEPGGRGGATATAKQFDPNKSPQTRNAQIRGGFNSG